MKGHIPENIIEEVRNRADIVSLISEFVTLKKAGRNFLGLCPFHQEKTPSFSVNPDKQIFHCFGCGEGGNVISFLMKMNQMDFPEAVRHLAGKTGVVIPEKVMTARDKEEIGIREQISRINEQAAVHFTKNLFSQAGQSARTYLKKRGMQEATVREFRLGFALDGWRPLKDYFEKQQIPLKVLETAGLLIPNTNKDGGFYDRFRGRLIFPIEDVNGRVIAFGGRVMGEGEPKYLNSPETPLYTKGKNLYGLNRTREDIRKKGYAILVEGYFDLISLWNAGVRNVIASLGTALTADQVALIKRYTHQVVAVFDPDAAGKKALDRSLTLFLAGGVHAKAAVLPDGYDPDDYVKTFGPEKFEQVMDHAQSMVDYYIETVIGPGESLEDHYDALRDAVPFIAAIDDTIERNLFIKRVAEKLGLEQELLKAQINQVLDKSKRTSAAPKIKVKPPDQKNAVEFAFIQMMLEQPAKIGIMADTYVLDYFLSEDLKKIGEEMAAAFKTCKTLETSAMIDGIGDHAMKEKLYRSMMNENTADNALIDRMIHDTIRHIKKKWYKDKKRTLQIEIVNAQEAGNQGLCNRLLAEKESLSREEKSL
ncbi:MAG: DNA primase [Deltaproteobacteria bacterium]|nr:DNA primase [Deltaproteobacteria bacterium]